MRIKKTKAVIRMLIISLCCALMITFVPTPITANAEDSDASQVTVHIVNILNRAWELYENTYVLHGLENGTASKAFTSTALGIANAPAEVEVNGVKYTRLDIFYYAPVNEVGDPVDGPVVWNTASDGDALTRIFLELSDERKVYFRKASGDTDFLRDDVTDVYISPVYTAAAIYTLNFNLINRISADGSSSWSNGGTAVTYYEHTFTAPSAGADHYQFQYWIDSATGNRYETGLKYSIFNGEETSDMTVNVYAMWKPSVTVNYIADGKTVKTTESFDSVSVYDYTPKCADDMQFDGWYDANGNKISKSTVYAAPEVTGADEEVTQPLVKDVYAKFSPKTKTVSGTLLAKMTSKGSKGFTFGWTKVDGAEGYDVFLSLCDSKEKKSGCKKVKTIKGNKTFKWTKKGLKKGKAYKAYVKAWIMKDGKKTYVKSSPLVHAYTNGGNKKFTNAKSVTVKKAKITLAKGKTFQIKASVSKLRAKKKLISKGHAAKLRYLSSNTKIATVSKAGKIKAKAKGSCKIYVYTVNGVSKTVSVTVK